MDCIHARYDYIGGVRTLKVRTDAAVALGKFDADVPVKRSVLTGAEWYGMEWGQVLEVDFRSQDGDRFSFGGMENHALHSPGQTPGTLSYFFTVHREGRTWRYGLHGVFGLVPLGDRYRLVHVMPIPLRADNMASLEWFQGEPVKRLLVSPPTQSRLFERDARIARDPLAVEDPVAWSSYLAVLKLNFRARFPEAARGEELGERG